MDDEERLGHVAERLGDIARSVADEAGTLAATLRTVGDQVADMAAFAILLEEAAEEIEASTQAQVKLLASAQRHVADNEPVMAGLASSAQTIAAMSAQICDIAGRSRLLSINARIEAARSDAGGGFAAVASAMTELAANTRAATQDIDERAAMIGRDVSSARAVIAAGVALVDREQDIIARIADRTAGQRDIAVRVRTLTVETVERVDHAVTGVGRVASTAGLLSMLAKQLIPKTGPQIDMRVAGVAGAGRMA